MAITTPKISSILLSLSLIFLNGCTSEESGKEDLFKVQLQILKEKIEALEVEVAELQDFSIDSNEWVSQQLWSLKKTHATFTPSSKGFSYLTTSEGYSFLVSLDKLSKYANGYKATFNIGNPSLITFNGLKANVSWGKTEASFEELKTQEMNITTSLLPGIWNKVTVVLSPATEEETGVIVFALVTETSTLHLGMDLRNETNYTN